MNSLEAENSVFYITDENDSFSVSIPSYLRFPSYLEDKIFDALNKLLKLIPENDLQLHVQEARKKGNQIKIGDKEYKSSDLSSSGNGIFEELQNATYQALEDLVFRMQLTYDEIMDVLDIKHFPSERTG